MFIFIWHVVVVAAVPFLRHVVVVVVVGVSQILPFFRFQFLVFRFQVSRKEMNVSFSLSLVRVPVSSEGEDEDMRASGALCYIVVGRCHCTN